MHRAQKIWFDFTNPPHVNFFLPLIKHFQREGYNVDLTAREFVETVKLLQRNDLSFRVFGKHGGRKRLSKVWSLVSRELKLLSNVKDFDFSFCSNYEAPVASWFKGKTSLVFDDNDISPNWLYAKFAKYVVSPSAIDKEAMFRMGINKDQLITYDGFKEDIYIADYIPDSEFLRKIPFSEFVTVRPENIKASYVPPGRKSIVPQLIKLLLQKGLNVLYLPRYESDREYIEASDQIFIPDGPLNGLDVSYYSIAVLTGAGTFSREAAVMGTPAVSFFAGDQFLGVDKKMFKDNWVHYSRDPKDIVSFVLNSKKKNINQTKSKEVQKELFEMLSMIMNKI
ncbi:MAG: hypothetical protein C0594_02820 [Marinilabiliales bacterium]|nr:MAG: hypothetical protein C0594_02820 [Marinilabiliales bacterium]